jgi:hypothetical protein
MNEERFDRFRELARALAHVIRHGRFPNGWGQPPVMRAIETVVSPAGVEFTEAEGTAGGRLMFPAEMHEIMKKIGAIK